MVALGRADHRAGSRFRHPDHGGRALSGCSCPGETWADHLTLAVTEIREYGSSSIQVVRWLRAILEDLQVSVRPEHRPAVDAEITKLDATVATGFAGSVDKDQARARDRQGIGGPAATEISSPAASS